MILFNGDSWCYGYGLENRDDRYATILSKKLNTDYTDLSTHGCSNRRIYRSTIMHDITKYELGVICMTFKNRTEFHLNGKWENINPGRGRGKKYIDYYRDYYSEEYGDSDEFIYRQAIIDHFKVNKVKLILLTNTKKSRYHYDLNINTPDTPLGVTLHPTKEGHGIIASKIYETYNKMV